MDGSNLEGTYRGRLADFAIKLCLANSPNMNWEVIEPVRGQSIYADFLERQGDGIQHLAFNCNGIEYEERIRQFEDGGYEAYPDRTYLRWHRLSLLFRRRRSAHGGEGGR
ncbi:VOC family protein [Mesorhizobium sp. M0244]|uniref:VOC family protein n=1 Tax=Mesorhizobium sp. M0244 TaxID=2956926 RepID=UPI00333736D1